MSELRKPFLNISKNLEKKQKINVKKPHVNKKQLPRNGKLVQRKTRPRMKYEWLGKTIQKESDPINKKTVKIKMKLPHMNKKPLATKQIFLQTSISHSTLK